MEKLIEILKEFDIQRDEYINKKNWKEKSDEEKYNAVAEWFRPCAEKILCEGYFFVNGKYIIDLGCIELYYHEENGDIKDPIMYHTNEHPSKSEVFQLNNGEYPYFKIGSFNLHQSGVDVTFESEKDKNDKYRASFLIRSYRVFKENEEDKVYDLSIPFDKCSTHIFDDMFYEGISFDKKSRTNIEWVKLKVPKEENIEVPLPRKNVAWYRKNGEKFEKVTESDFINNEKRFYDDGYFKPVNYPQFFPYNGKSYLQDPKLWQFKRKNIKER